MTISSHCDSFEGVVSATNLLSLCAGRPHLAIEGLCAGYGGMEILHKVDLFLGRSQSLCLIGPNGAGKSTVLHSLFGLSDVHTGRILVNGRDFTGSGAAAMLMQAKAAYVLQTNSIFPDMTVEENLLLGGYLGMTKSDLRAAVERILDTYPQLARHRSHPSGALSGGQRRMLELSRALMLDPDLILVDEPSIGLEPRAIEAVFEMLRHLQRTQEKTIVIVEQNAKKGLEFADLGYVMVAGQVVFADRAFRLLDNPDVGRMFLGR